MEATLLVLKYQKGTQDKGLLMSKHSGFTPHAYCDSRRSVSRIVVFVAVDIYSWKSKKQQNVSLSSAMIEYRSLRRACAELA